MSKTRLELQTALESLSGLKGVYFQPPESVKLKYDCIVYAPAVPDIQHADNMKYLKYRCYRLTLISRDPECALSESILDEFQYIKMLNIYHTENLHHWVYNLFY